MLDTELAWAAGFLDGEGHFGLARQGGKHRITDDARQPFIKATQVVPEPLEKLKAMFGGTVNARGTKTSTGKTAYDWTIRSGVRVREVVPLIEPYLIVKREQALIVLEFASKMRIKGTGSYALSEEEKEWRRTLITKMELTRL